MKSDKKLAKNEIKRLIALYDDLVKTGQYDKFNEDETCRKLILPLFKALGWDTDAKIIADEVTGQHDAGGQKRVDYSFNINSQPVLFLEAKQLSVDLYNPNYANQAINYGYSKTVKWVILSDFEGIKVFNSLVKTRRLSEKTIIDLKHTDYLEKFDILWLLSKENIVDGKLNEYAKTFGHVDNKIPINELLLSRLLKWRDILITQIASDNPKLSKDEVSECVQKLINRLIFIRTCEDRKIEEPFLLKNIQNEWKNDSSKYLHKMLAEVFKEFDREYDSSLFEKHEIDNVKVRDNILDDIIGGIYEDLDEDVSFDFSAIDSDVLGSIYEQYLGTIQNEESKGIRKSQGIYYTPKYIVDYIVESTLGKIIEEKLSQKKYEEIGKLRVLDPACGSGSFLLKVLELFDSAYAKSPEYAKYPLTRKIRALGKNIYGVDLDTEAVELTRLNLLLSSINRNKKLPNLSHNIECGNSLIEDPKIAGDKAFDWNKRFKFVMEDGGFDVIIGNPPYIGFHGFKNEKDYLSTRYKTTRGKYDLYVPFIEKSIELLNEGGIMAFICPSAFMKRDYGEALRKYLLDNVKILEIVDFQDEKIFSDALNYTCIIIIQKSSNIDNVIMVKERKIEAPSFTIKQNDLSQNSWVFSKHESKALIEKLIKNDRLGDIAKISEGVVTGNNNVFLLKKEDTHFEAEISAMAIRGNEVRRYFIEPHEYVLFYPYLQENSRTIAIDEITLKKKYPDAYKYVLGKKKELSGREYFNKSSKHWYELWNQRKKADLTSAKIVTPELSDSNRFALSSDGAFSTDTVCHIIPKDDYKEDIRYLLAVLNSRLIEYYYKKCTVPKASGFYIFKVMYLKDVPIKRLNLKTPKESSCHKRICGLVDNIMSLNKEYYGAKDKITEAQETIARKIGAIEEIINSIVYELYGVSPEEIKVVDGEAKSK